MRFSKNTLLGEVVDFQFGNYRIDCDSPVEYLKVHFLSPSLMNGAKVGDKVELKYRSNLTSGSWYVSRVI